MYHYENRLATFISYAYNASILKSPINDIDNNDNVKV